MARLFAFLALLCFGAVVLHLTLGPVNLLALGLAAVAACLLVMAPAGWEWRRP